MYFLYSTTGIWVFISIPIILAFEFNNFWIFHRSPIHKQNHFSRSYSLFSPFFCICYYCCLLYAECPKGNLSILHIILLCKIQCCLCFVVVCICFLNSKLADVLHSNYFQLGYFQTTLFKSFLCLNICKKKKRKKINDINLYLNLNFVSSNTTRTNHRNLSKHMHIFVDNRKVGIFRSPFLSVLLWICKYAEQTFL